LLSTLAATANYEVRVVQGHFLNGVRNKKEIELEIALLRLDPRFQKLAASEAQK
jgi:hypothetical protein